MQLPHRDIYVGYIAGSIAKQGGFGSEISACAFYYANLEPEEALAEAIGGAQSEMCDTLVSDAIEVAMFDKELPCVIDMYKRYLAGEMVSSCISLNKRVYEGDEVDIVSQARAQLEEHYAAEFAKKIEAYLQKPERALEAEVEKLISLYSERCADNERAQVVNGLLAHARAQKCVDAEFVRANALDLEFDPDPLAFWGFAYREDGEVKTYANAYAPTVWKRWIEASCPSGIVYEEPLGKGSPVGRKKAFENKLKELFSDDYFEVVETF